MAKNGITGEAQDRIVQSITSFALYGFPESHAASFALLAYASAYFKCHYLAAFTCALLNNQPMGFYHPAVLVKDAQRHGLRVLPVDVNVSEWDCTMEERAAACCGWGCGMCAACAPRRACADRGGAGRFADVDDLARRVPELRKDELEMLAGVGALESAGDGASAGCACGRRGARGGRWVRCWRRCRRLRPEAPLRAR